LLCTKREEEKHVFIYEGEEKIVADLDPPSSLSFLFNDHLSASAT
jgi:hypothetical protein